MQRQLQRAVDKLRTTRDIYDEPDNVDPEVAQKLTGYLSTVRRTLFESYRTGVIDETLRRMENDRCFDTLRLRGDPLATTAT